MNKKQIIEAVYDSLIEGKDIKDKWLDMRVALMSNDTIRLSVGESEFELNCKLKRK